MSDNIVLSIVTPCYKTPKYYLERLFLSISLVKFNVEWIIVDDTPDSDVVRTIAEVAARILPHFKLISHTENQGITASYSDGFRAAKGKFIGIVDHDDEVDLRVMVDLLIETDLAQSDLIYTNEKKFNHVVDESYYKPAFDRLSSAYYYYPHHIALFRSDIAQRALARRQDLMQLAGTTFDIAFWYAFLSQFETVPLRAVMLPVILYGWRVHQASTAGSIDQKPAHLAERIKLARQFLSEYEREGFEIVNRDDVPYVVEGRFGVTFADGLAYAESCFDLSFVSLTDGNFVEATQVPVATDELALRLSRVPMNYLSRCVGGRTVYIAIGDEDVDEHEHEHEHEGHVPGVPYLSERHSLPEGFYLALQPKAVPAEPGEGKAGLLQLCVREVVA